MRSAPAPRSLLKELRLRSGLSLRTASQAAGLSVPLLTLYERGGHLHRPTPEQIAALSLLYGADLGALLAARRPRCQP